MIPPTEANEISRNWSFTVVGREKGAHSTPGHAFGGALLAEHGYRSRDVLDSEWQPQEQEVVIVRGNLNWYPRVRRRLLSGQLPSRLLVALWHFEPLPPPRASGLPWPVPRAAEIAKILLRDCRATDPYTNYFLIRRFVRLGLPHILAVSTRPRVAFLAEHGIVAHYVPVGYSSRLGCDLGLERDLDVLFLGEHRLPYRRRAIRRLRSAGVPMTVAGQWGNPEYWGENRTRLLNRTKIFLNIPRFRGEFAGLRFLTAMANKTLLVSEPVYDPYPFEPGRHFVSASPEEMPSVINHYLACEQERRRIVDEAYDFATQQQSLQRSQGQIVDLIVQELKQHLG